MGNFHRGWKGEVCDYCNLGSDNGGYVDCGSLEKEVVEGVDTEGIEDESLTGTMDDG